MTDKPTVGFIGVGFMGHGMAKNILQGGYPLWVKGNRNRTPVDSLVGMGATEAKTPREMAENCDVIHICLSNSPQVEAVFHGPDGILAGARSGLIVVDTTTADPTSTEALAAALAEKGGMMVDAPLGRTPKEAEAGTLDAMVGADDAVFKQVLPIIDCWGRHHQPCRSDGCGPQDEVADELHIDGHGLPLCRGACRGDQSGIDPTGLRQGDRRQPPVERVL